MLYCIFKKCWFCHFRLFLHLLSLFCIEINSVSSFSSLRYCHQVHHHSEELLNLHFFFNVPPEVMLYLTFLFVFFLKTIIFSKKIPGCNFYHFIDDLIHIAFSLHILTVSLLSIIQSKKPCLQDRLRCKLFSSSTDE